jgi:flagellar biosynthetic protein FlhB
MADDSDDSQKTEDPSWRKLDEARQRGQVAQSREVSNWFVMTGGVLALMIFAPRIAAAMQHLMLGLVEQAGTLRLDGAFFDSLRSALVELALALLPAFAVMMVMGAAGTVLQTGFLWAPDKLVPKLDHISPLAGFKRLFSLRSVMEFLKGLLKMLVVGGVAFTTLVPELDRLPMLPSLGAGALAQEIATVSLRLAGAVIAVLTAIALGDYVYQRLSFMRSMRMSKQEVKEEYKHSEGDPFIKSKLRQIRTERARRRMMAAVPTASVVVTNPTHFAVALHYEQNSAGAPKLVAKGADLIAARIREIARQHDVPIVENPPVARALYASVEIDQEIQPEHYKAVAEIIGYVFRLKGKLKSR